MDWSVFLIAGMALFDFKYFILSKPEKLLVTIMYFSISIYLTNRYFNTLIIEKPLFIKITDWIEHIKDNLWLVIICCLSLVLHIHFLSLDLIVTGGAEKPYLFQSALIYDFLNGYWYRLFDFPIQYFFWSLIVLLILIMKQKKMIRCLSNYFKERFSKFKSNKSLEFLFIFSI